MGGVGGDADETAGHENGEDRGDHRQVVGHPDVYRVAGRALSVGDLHVEGVGVEAGGGVAGGGVNRGGGRADRAGASAVSSGIRNGEPGLETASEFDNVKED